MAQCQLRFVMYSPETSLSLDLDGWIYDGCMLGSEKYKYYQVDVIYEDMRRDEGAHYYIYLCSPRDEGVRKRDVIICILKKLGTRGEGGK